MEKRLTSLEVLSQASPQAIEHASWDIQWGLQYPSLEDPAVRAACIRDTHALDDAGVMRAMEVALIRCGTPRGEVQLLSALGLEHLLSIAQRATEAA